MIVIDILIWLAIAYSMIAGYRRGGFLVALELFSFILATVVAISSYQWLGMGLKSLTRIPLSLANIAAFLLIWMVVEIVSAEVLRRTVIRSYHERFKMTFPIKLIGAVLNGLKAVLLIIISLVIITNLPIPSKFKNIVTDSPTAHVLIKSSGVVQVIISKTLAQDINNSLNFFTITSKAESHEKIDLGFTTTQGVVDETREQEMLKLINYERVGRGLKPLTVNPEARAVARNYSKTMLAGGYFSHLDATGRSPFDRMRAGGVEFGSAGENLALAPTLVLAHQGLMNSPGHRENILSPNYLRVGIGVVDAGIYGLMITQNFTD